MLKRLFEGMLVFICFTLVYCHHFIHKDTQIPKVVNELKYTNDISIDSLLTFDSISSWQIGLSYHYPDGAYMHTTFNSNGYVNGERQSADKFPFVHMGKDTAPEYFLDTLFRFATDVIKSCKPFDLSVKNNPSVHLYICISFCDKIRKSYEYQSTVCNGFDQIPLIKLSSLISKNMVYYGHNDWNLDYNKYKRDFYEIYDCKQKYDEAFKRGRRAGKR